MSRNRNWVFTLNNYTIDDPVHLRQVVLTKGKYGIWGEEVGENGTPHLQGYIEFTNPISLCGLKKLHARAHWAVRMGTQEQARNYCMKDGKYTEVGTFIKQEQGKRVDLDQFKDQILAGRSVDDIALEHPGVYHQYGRTLNMYEDLYLRRQFRTEMTQGIWLWGSTGVGKSHRAFQNYSPSTHYKVNLTDKGWWEGYRQQETVIINDFRGEIKYNDLLNIIDKWPYSVPRRGREPMPFTSKTVIITSSLPPWEVYKNRLEEDSLEQLYRRVVVERV